jgi:hypothetical protein
MNPRRFKDDYFGEEAEEALKQEFTPSSVKTFNRENLIGSAELYYSCRLHHRSASKYSIYYSKSEAIGSLINGCATFVGAGVAQSV